MNTFPKATPRKPIYEIAGCLYERVPAADALSNPDAIRASVDVLSGKHKGEKKIGWFVFLKNSPIGIDTAKEALTLKG